jgi:nitrogen regulatory protein PII
MNQKLLICFIHKKRLLDQILAKLIELGTGGATVINTTGIGRSKMDDIILYEGFKDVLRGAQKDHYTVLCVIKKKNIKAVAESLSELYDNFAQKGVGFFLTMPIDNVWGIHSPENKKVNTFKLSKIKL